jgi:hypothetical protein
MLQSKPTKFAVLAAHAKSLTARIKLPAPSSHPVHDAYDENGDVQIKMTASKSIAMYDLPKRLVVLRIVSAEEAEIVFDGPGELAWTNAGKRQKSGQRVVTAPPPHRGFLLTRLSDAGPAPSPARLQRAGVRKPLRTADGRGRREAIIAERDSGRRSWGRAADTLRFFRAGRRPTRRSAG